MVVGFNHNIRYKGELFHVQTEDSGRANPHIITLLYRGGTILASSKTSYADIIKADQLELVVEAIMKEQHKDMMRRLKGGEFDARIFPGQAAAAEPAPGEGDRHLRSQSPAPAPGEGDRHLRSQSPAPAPAPAPGEGDRHLRSQSPTQQAPVQQAPRIPEPPRGPTMSPAHDTPPASPATRSLDEVILDYLITGEDK